jgi:IclR family KDG regulon transcriptional repressor
MKSTTKDSNNTKEFKRVPALDKGVKMLELLAQSKNPLGLTEIARALGYHAGTVYNIVYTFVDLGILETEGHKKFALGKKLHALGKAASRQPEIVQRIHPFLEEINEKTKLTTLLNIRSGLQSVVIDKVESSYDLRFSPEYGRSLSMLGGAVGRAILSQLPDKEIDEILSKHKLKKYTPHSQANRKKFKEMVMKVRQEGIAISMEERTEGVCAFAVPLPTVQMTEPIAIWVVGLKNQIQEKGVPFYVNYLKKQAKKILTIL